MSQNDKHPLHHPAPVHDVSEFQPGLGSLASTDGSHRSTSEPTPPGIQSTTSGSLKTPDIKSDKLNVLDSSRKGSEDFALTINQGVRITDDQNSLRAGNCGLTLLEDFILREKITHFDHEHIPERIVYARGSAAHDCFQSYANLSATTKADFLSDESKTTPVFVRSSIVQDDVGSADTVKDIWGFATKFYTEEGTFDLVGNNTSIFFIQDAHKFLDSVHAVKPEPHWAILQGQSAHDTFQDYISLQPETLYNVIWTMSDRGIPRSYHTTEGSGIHTFWLINAQGKATFVRLHWKPLAGKVSLVRDEAQKLTGRDPDFHRRGLREAIEVGDYPEYELGLQLIPGEDEFKFDFDLLDPTKLIPEELVPVQRIGKMVLNRNSDNFFTGDEQVAFHPGHIVPGIDFISDPPLQGHSFSYTDTQISRLGGSNLHEIPINRPICPYHSFQHDGMHRMDIDTNPTNYEPNSINDNWPRETSPGSKRGGFESYQERIEGNKIRERSPSSGEYYAHPCLFWLSQTPIEQQHIIDRLSFELSKVMRSYIRGRVVERLAHIDIVLVGAAADNLGFRLAREQASTAPPSNVNGLKNVLSPSLYASAQGETKSCVVAILLNDQVKSSGPFIIMQALQTKGTHAKLLYPWMGKVVTGGGSTLMIAGTFAGPSFLTVDAVIAPCGNLADIIKNGDVRYYLLEAYKHLKPIALSGDVRQFKATLNIKNEGEEGVVEVDYADTQFMGTLLTLTAAHRIWSHARKIETTPV